MAHPRDAHQGFNGNEEFGYLGPNPTLPPPVHIYAFRLYALNTERLTLRLTITAGELKDAMRPHIVGAVNFVGTYQLAPATPPSTPGS